MAKEIKCSYKTLRPRALTFSLVLLFGLLCRSHAPLNWTKSVTADKESPTTRSIARADLLTDPLDRVSDRFDIPQELRPRVSFWFDIYTKYNSSHHVIHHRLYPWIVYSIVDTSKIMKMEGNYWRLWHKAQDQVTQEKKRIHRALRSLAKKRSYKKLPALEAKLFNQLKWLRGKRQSVIRKASQSVRVQIGQKDFFLKGLRNSGKYLTHMENLFADHGLPTELTRLPFVESSFNEKAYSRVGASGVWQIMPATGRALGTVNRKIDERQSPIKATAIAARLLKRYYSSLKSWPLAVTAYNHGIGGIRKAIDRTGSRDLPTIIRKYHKGSFRFASSNFYSCFLSALYAEKYYRELFSPQETAREKPIAFEVANLTRSLKAQTVAKYAGIPLKTLLKLNPDIRSKKRNTRLPRGYEVHLPKGKKEIFVETFSQKFERKKKASI